MLPSSIEPAFVASEGDGVMAAVKGASVLVSMAVVVEWTGVTTGEIATTVVARLLEQQQEPHREHVLNERENKQCIV